MTILPGSAATAHQEIQFTFPETSELAPRGMDQGYTIDLNGARWRGLLVGMRRDLDGILTISVRLLDSTPIGYGPSE